ncbi:MAG TPA: S49 family peptidase [Roseococcus sp.]|nr:S49 family peptidase [Roseococcus sp.]
MSLLAALASEGILAVAPEHLGRAPAQRQDRGGAVAIIPVTGALFARGVSGWFGTVPGMDTLRARLATAAANPDIGSIVLDIDSPGGTVAGTAETAAAVARAAAQKPVVAVANTLAASAAYWIASQATEVVMAPNAMAGSIGVIAVHQNAGKLYERMGIETTLIRSGPRKAEGHPFGPLDETAREAIQARVDEAATAFLDAVAAGRKVTAKAARERFGEGQVFGAAEAVAAGLADRVATLDEVVAGMASGRGRAWRRRSSFAFA